MRINPQPARDLLFNSPVGKQPHIQAAWSSIIWNPCQPLGTATFQSGNPSVINVFPCASKLPAAKQTEAMIREFGINLFQKAGPDLKRVWELKLCLPELAQIEAVRAKLGSPDFATYKELTESFQTAADRLVCLNLCNALLASHVPRGQARQVDILTWSSTADYAGLKRTHSLRPLITAYATREIASCPGCALAELATNQLRSVRETSVAKAFQRIIEDTFGALR